MAIYHDQAVQFLINQLNRVSANLRMQECRPMNHHEKNQNLYARQSYSTRCLKLRVVSTAVLRRTGQLVKLDGLDYGKWTLNS